MKLIKSLIQKIKKNKVKMISEEKLINYKQNFTGQTFQWVKTDRPELMGKIVKCRDIQPFGNSALAIFEDGSKIDVKQLNSNLMMIVGDMQPLSREEVRSLSPGASAQPKSSQNTPPPPPTSPTGSGPIEIPDELKEYQTPKEKQPQAKPAPSSDGASSEPKVVSKNPFEMFNSDYSDLNLKMSVKIPDKKLLKLMYSNAENKDEFMEQLSEYIYSMINNKVVRESLESILVTKTRPKKTKEKSEDIKLTEVDDE
jgi:hypothetical protein